MQRITIIVAILIAIASIISIAHGGHYAAAGWAVLMVGAILVALYLSNLYDKACEREAIADHLDRALRHVGSAYDR